MAISEPVPIEDEIATLRAETEKSLRSLSRKRRRFVEYLVSLDNMRQSAIKAGYSERSAHTTANRLLKDENVKKAYELACQVDAIDNGIPVSTKRAWLIDVINKSRQVEYLNPAGVKGCVELLARLDKDDMTADTAVNLQLPVMKLMTGTVVDHQDESSGANLVGDDKKGVPLIRENRVQSTHTRAESQAVHHPAVVGMDIGRADDE